MDDEVWSSIVYQYVKPHPLLDSNIRTAAFERWRLFLNKKWPVTTKGSTYDLMMMSCDVLMMSFRVLLDSLCTCILWRDLGVWLIRTHPLHYQIGLQETQKVHIT